MATFALDRERCSPRLSLQQLNIFCFTQAAPLGLLVAPATTQQLTVSVFAEMPQFATQDAPEPIVMEAGSYCTCFVRNMTITMV